MKLNILLFHGVSNSASISPRTSVLQNYNNKHISDIRFKEILNYLDSTPHPVLSINDIVLINQGHLEPPDHAYAITFDDGFSNNFDVAVPLLSKYHMPATFYLSTSLIGSSCIFWVDYLELIIAFSCVSEIHVSNLIDIKILPISFESKSSARDISLLSINQKIKFLDLIKPYFKLMQPAHRNLALAELEKLLKASMPDKNELHPDYKPATWDQVEIAAANPLFTIGGHSQHHDILSTLSKSELDEDIKGSINTLTSKLGSFSGHFAYPEGQIEHFNADVIAELKKHGILCSPAAFPGIATESTDLFHLPRNMVDFNFSTTVLDFPNSY